MRKYDGLINGLISVEGIQTNDKRGFFYEKYNLDFLRRYEVAIVQENISKSIKGTIRGMHWQVNPNAQAKLITCITGTIYDVAVDLRKHSETFGYFSSVTLSGETNTSLWIPVGFAHGFQAVEASCIISYSVTSPYSRSDARAINPLCPTLGIDWPLDDSILSDSDTQALNFDELAEEVFFSEII